MKRVIPSGFICSFTAWVAFATILAGNAPPIGAQHAKSPAARRESKLSKGLKAPTTGTLRWTPAAMAQLLQMAPERPVVAPPKYRSGPGTFRAVAPAVVVVRTW